MYVPLGEPIEDVYELNIEPYVSGFESRGYTLVSKKIKDLRPGECGFCLSWGFGIYRGNEIWANGNYPVEPYVGGTIQIPFARLHDGFAVSLDDIRRYEEKYGDEPEVNDRIGSPREWHDLHVKYIVENGILRVDDDPLYEVIENEKFRNRGALLGNRERRSTLSRLQSALDR